jgi:DnaJ-class molecular chaperone
VRPWWEVFEIPKEAVVALSVGMVEARYRELAAKFHPDRGGNPEAMTELNRARDDARKHYGTA